MTITNASLDNLLQSLFGDKVGPISPMISARLVLDDKREYDGNELGEKFATFGIRGVIEKTGRHWTVTAPCRPLYDAATREHQRGNPRSGIAGALNQAFYHNSDALRVLVPVPDDAPMRSEEIPALLHSALGFQCPPTLNNSHQPPLLELTWAQFQSMRSQWQSTVDHDSSRAHLTQMLDTLQPKDGAFGTAKKHQSPNAGGSSGVFDLLIDSASRLRLTGDEVACLLSDEDAVPEKPSRAEPPAQKPQANDVPPGPVNNVIRVEFGRGRRPG